jgi:LmbE family N-acetylglucosaminyl deacetylase
MIILCPVSASLFHFKRVLVVAAHPDDIDFGAAGTVASLTAQGVEVSYVIVTDGDAGGFDPGIPREDIPGIRRAEQMQAARVVDVADVEFLGHPDGKVAADLALRRDISRSIRRVRPELVICPSPDRDFSRLPASHPDHLATGEATICAVYPDARNRFAFSELLGEGLEPHVVGTVWLMAAPKTNFAFDITDAFDRKVQALLSHVSQHIDANSTIERVRAWNTAAAAAADLGDGRLAESFFVFDVP